MVSRCLFQHLGADAKVPDDDDFAEMICGTCMDKLPFLWSYNPNASQGILLFEFICS